MNPEGLLALAAIPAIVLLSAYRRRLPVRRVAGVFLWGTPAAASPGPGRRIIIRLTGSLVRDLIAALILVVLACDVRIGGPGPAGGAEGTFDATLRVVLCVTCAVLVGVTWRPASPGATPGPAGEP